MKDSSDGTGWRIVDKELLERWSCTILMHILGTTIRYRCRGYSSRKSVTGLECPRSSMLRMWVG